MKVDMALLKLIRELCYKEGDFTLSSGKKSTFYIDLKNLTLHPKGIYEISKMLWENLDASKYGGVGGPTLGADPMATAFSLAALAQNIFLPAFILRKEPKKYGTSLWVEGVLNLKKEKPLLVVEDVVTTGASSLRGIHQIRQEGFTVNELFCIVDRDEGGNEALKANGITLHRLCSIAEIKNVR